MARKRARSVSDGGAAPAKASKTGGKSGAEEAVVEKEDARLAELRDHAAFFERMLSMIPAEMYLAKTDEENELSWRQRRFAKNVKGAAPKADIKSLSKKERKANKRAKLDPDATPTVDELRQKRKREEEEAEEAENENEDNEADQHASGSTEGRPVTVDPSFTGVEALRARLAERMEKLRTQRKAEKMSHEAIVQRRNAPKNKPRKVNPVKPSVTADSASSDSAAAEATDAGTVGENLTFNKFDLANGAEFAGTAKKKRKTVPSDPRQALAQLEAKQRKLEDLKAKDAEKATRLEEKLDWEGVLARARGEKVKDDPKLLKKAAKRKEKEKKKSANQWSDRLKAVEEGKAKRQKQREENIKARREQKQNKGKSGKSGKGSKGGKGGKDGKGSKGGKKVRK